MQKKITIEGLVQGIGYRPFVAETARKLHISGNVKNSGGIVTIQALGDEVDVYSFIATLKTNCPIGGRVDKVSVSDLPTDEFLDYDDFLIVSSDDVGIDKVPFIPADLCTCEDCKRELKTSYNRRFKHPFISCVNCGPRYSIIEALPYDRPRITMKDFKLCDECHSEYVTYGDRRHHAQTIACPNCGPKIKIEGSLEGVFALKDIGGYHLVCSPYDESAVTSLRAMKGRESKPFAVMFADVNQIKEYCQVNELEEKLLTSSARPVVLLNRKNESDSQWDKMCDSVFGKSPYMGAMLPCNPLQIMLVEERGPLIMTSANTSGGSMIIDDGKMREWIAQKAKHSDVTVPVGIISHDREILTPLDDSVVQVVNDKPLYIRRARGYVPNPIDIDTDERIFAAGADLKVTFFYVQDGRAYPSGPAGDLQEQDSIAVYNLEKERMKTIFGFKPDKYVVDRHPLYFSVSQINEPKIKVAHHKAHVASVIAEHHLLGDVLGVAFDGTGFGDDGTVWGGEFFLFTEKDIKRVGSLKPVLLTGGDQGAKNALSSMYGYLADARYLKSKSTVVEMDKLTLTIKANEMKINRVKSSSMGRLFDAISAYLGICDNNGYEGQAPMELEYVASMAECAAKLSIPVENNQGVASALFEQIDNALKVHSVAEVALGFHYAVADFILQICQQNSPKQVVLSGGTFCNRILLSRTEKILESAGFSVYHNEQVPCTDAGLCLGQAWLCARNLDCK